MKLTVDWLDDNWFTREGKVITPRGYGYAYSNFNEAFDIYYPLLINYIVRYWRKCYWQFLRFFYWIGLIDIAPREAFHWGAFYRIKVH